jgi:hypothetical protein
VHVSTQFQAHAFRTSQTENLDCPLSGVRYFSDLQVVVDFQKEEERLYGVECVFGRSVVRVTNSLHMI